MVRARWTTPLARTVTSSLRCHVVLVTLPHTAPGPHSDAREPRAEQKQRPGLRNRSPSRLSEAKEAIRAIVRQHASRRGGACATERCRQPCEERTGIIRQDRGEQPL